MKNLHVILWSVACALLFYWFFTFAALHLIEAQHNPTVVHYEHKLCPAPQRTPGRG